LGWSFQTSPVKAVQSCSFAAAGEFQQNGFIEPLTVDFVTSAFCNRGVFVKCERLWFRHGVMLLFAVGWWSAPHVGGRR
jgi:hypothetical protein